MNGMESDGIAVIDFDAYSLEKEFPDKDKLPQLVDEIHHALTTIGFFYLKNTGMATDVMKDAFEKSKIFFTSGMEEKMKYDMFKVVPNSRFGFTSVNQERLNMDTDVYDLKESFNYLPDKLEKVFHFVSTVPLGNQTHNGVRMIFMERVQYSRVIAGLGRILKRGVTFKLKVDGEVLKGGEKGYDMIKALHTYFKQGRILLYRVLEVMAISLELDDPHFFVKKYKLCGKEGGLLNLRSIFYPGVNEGDVITGQLRCGEHSDYGGITFLIQDRPGLQVRNLKGEWTPAPPIDGTVVVNIGDLMQRWTADKFVAGKHRVLLPESEEDLKKSRQSIVFFGQPDYDEIVECIDGSGKYPPIKSGEYVGQKLSQIFRQGSDFKLT